MIVHDPAKLWPRRDIGDQEHAAAGLVARLEIQLPPQVGLREQSLPQHDRTRANDGRHLRTGTLEAGGRLHLASAKPNAM